MELVELNKTQLNNFLSKQRHAQFLQSWEWGEFQKSLGFLVFRVGVIDDKEIIAVSTLIKKNIIGERSYFFCPRGVDIESQITDYKLRIKIYTLLFKEIERIAKKEKCVFLRFEPLEAVKNNDFRLRKTIDLEPAKTTILNLEKPEEELLREMHSKTRYNIRLAERKGVKVCEVDVSEFEKVWEVMRETSSRDGFRLHNKEYYQKMISSSLIKVFIAEYDGQIITANIISFFGDMATYVHGASSNKYRNVMAPYLVQWVVIKKAKELNYRYYDFFGVDEDKWPGVTRFKRGFSGDEVCYPGTFDLIFDKSIYLIYNLARTIRRLF